jgi:hypothetical protein
VGLRRAGAIALAVLVALGGAIGLLALVAARDSAPVRPGAEAGPGEPVPGGAPAGLSPALRRTLARGNVLLAYGTPAAPAGLRALADDVQGGPPDPALAAAGQAVLPVREPGTNGVVALAWGRRLRAAAPADPALRRFAEVWLGRGAR